MYPLFETVCIYNSQIKNGPYHERRFRNACIAHFEKEPDFSLFDTIEIPEINSSLLYKLKIKYTYNTIQWSISEYKNKIPATLKLIHDDTISYDLKFSDRTHLNCLYEKRGLSEDVLIVKNGCITDATYSNILFTDGHHIVTPATPLLKGTCRDRLLGEKKIQEALITLDHLHNFTHFQLINAMNDFDSKRWVTTQHIRVA